MNSRILMVGMLSSALFQSGSGYLQLESAPVEKTPTLLAQEGLSVFDLEVDRQGRVQNESLSARSGKGIQFFMMASPSGTR